MEYLNRFSIQYPVTLIIFEYTILEKITYIISYAFNGSIPEPTTPRDLCYIAYYMDTAKTWKGVTMGRLEFRAYGEEPTFSILGTFKGKFQFSEIIGGYRTLYEWNYIINNSLEFGIMYYRDESIPLTPSEITNIIVEETFNLTDFFLPIISCVLIRRWRRHRK